MRVTRLAVRHRTSALFLTLLLVVAGIFSYLTIPKESNPSIAIPNIVVTTTYPGASPEEVADLVTAPIERELQGAAGIEEIRSTSREGLSSIVVEFGTDVPIDEADQRVRQRVERASARLPADVQPPVVREINIAELPILTINLLAPYALDRLEQVSEELQEELETISSVLRVDTIGGLTREVQVNVDLTALQGYGLTFQDLVRTIEGENVALPGGSIEVDRQDYQVRVDGRFADPSRIADLVVAAPGARPVYVRDVATVNPDGFKERDSYARIAVLRERTEDGELAPVEERGYEPAISLAVRKRSGENVLATARAVRDVIDGFDFPSGTEVLITGDRSENVRTLVSDLENNLLSGMILIFLALLLFLGLRPALVAGAAVPLTLLLVFIVFRVSGQALNFIVLFSLIIALGILVDYTLMIVENIQRHREQGRAHWEAVREATDEIGRPVTVGTLTTVAVLVPLLFWSGVTGEFLRFIPLTLITTLLCALFVALIIAPTLAGYLLRGPDDDARAPGRRGRPSPWPRRLGYGALAFVALLLAAANPISLAVLAGAAVLAVLLYRWTIAPAGRRLRERALPRAIGWYQGALGRALERDYGVPHAYWRNAAALGAFAAGCTLLAIGGLLASLVGRLPALVALAPGALLALLGVLGILLHAAETLLLGRRTSVVAGLAIAAAIALILLPQVLGDGPLRWPALLLLPAPALLAALLGAVGLVVLGDRRHLVLTDNRARTMVLALAGTFAIGGLFALAPSGAAFFPDTDPNQIRVELHAPVGTPVATSNVIAERAVARLDSLFDRDPAVQAGVENVVVNVGASEDEGFAGGGARAALSRITLNLVDFDERQERSTVTLGKVREAFRGFAGAEVEIERSQQGPPSPPPVNVEVSGEEFARVVEFARQVTRTLRDAAESGRVPGLVDVTSNLEAGQPQLRVRVDRERASLFGLSTGQIAGTVRAAVEGVRATTFREGEDEYDITVRLREADRRDLQSLERLTIGRPAAAAGAGAAADAERPAGGDAGAPSTQVPLVAVADLQLESALGAVTRLDLEPLVTIQGDAAPGFDDQAVLAQVRQLLQPLQDSLPPGYAVRFTGQQTEMDQSFQFLGVALALGLGLLLLILVAQFDSVIVPLIILVAVGFTMAGVVLGLVLTRTPFGLFTFLGIISLSGIVVDDDIVIHEFIEQARTAGRDKRDAILEAVGNRFRQVVLVAITTIAGLVPLTFGLNVDFVGLLAAFEPDFQLGGENTQFWRPLGIVIMAGLPFATLVTLLVTPVLYSLFDSASVAAARLLGRDPAAGSLVPRHRADDDAPRDAGRDAGRDADGEEDATGAPAG